MFLIVFGERVHGASLDAGEKACPVCHRRTRFAHVVETNYFCVFGLRLLPIQKVANYYQCSECGNPFDEHIDVPTQIPLIGYVLAYLMAGYGVSEHKEVAREVCRKISGFDLTDRELIEAMRNIDAAKQNVFELLRRRAMSINAHGALHVVQAAFLMTHVCCEMQHADRVRINLIGNALGVSLEFVKAAIESVREQKYFGVHRLLPSSLA